MMLRTNIDAYNRQDPFRIKPAAFQAAFKANLAKFDAIDGKTDWTPENTTKWVTRMSAGNYLVVDTSKPCSFDKPSYLDIEHEQTGGPRHTTCGGRTPAEDSFDTTVSWLVRRTPETSEELTDGVDAPSKPVMKKFPYLAAP
jgi:hypothetical protein